MQKQPLLVTAEDLEVLVADMDDQGTDCVVPNAPSLQHHFPTNTEKWVTCCKSV
jgi:hypothetical protein